MYLKVLYEVRSKHEVARVRDVANRLGVSPGAVSGALKKLETAGFVEHEPYGVVALTVRGVAVAECMLRRHDTIREVLIQVFGVDPEHAAEDACLMEHAVSPTTINRMVATLERLRDGKIRIPPDPAADSKPVHCSECETLGYCQAAAAGEDP
jgi:DtxR family transcriptional regulator, Mn-dependent transcriptional regulator